MNIQTPILPLNLDSYSIGIGMSDEQKAVCLIMSYDALEQGGDIAMLARTAQLVENDLHLVSSIGTLVLKNVAQAIQDGARLKLPVVVLDPERERETIVETWLM